MHFQINSSPRGFSITVSGDSLESCPFNFIYPEKIWKAYPAKGSLIRELAYVTVLALPLIIREKKVFYNISKPYFIDEYHNSLKQALPSLVKNIPTESSEELLDHFDSISQTFIKPENNEFNISDICTDPVPQRVIIPFSFGKDSILTLSYLMEKGYELYPVIIDEGMLPRGFKLKKKRVHVLRNLGLECNFITNNIQNLSDFEILGLEPTRLYQPQAYYIYLLAMLPFCHYYNAPVIALNNEYPNSLITVSREGYAVPSNYLQSSEQTSKMKNMVYTITGNKVTVINPIEALGDFAIHSLLHAHYPDMVKHRMSCHLELTSDEHWCGNCDRCSRAFIFSTALGISPDEACFNETRPMSELIKHLSCSKKISRHDKFNNFRAKEERLAMLWALKKGYTEVDRIKKGISQKRLTSLFEKKLKREIFSIHIPKREAHPIEEKAWHDFDLMLRPLREN